MRVKICGLTRRADVALAEALGATHVGCVLAPDSPRRVSAREAARVLSGRRRSIPVLVFRRAGYDEVLRAVGQTGVRTIQVHLTDERVARALEARGIAVLRALRADRGSLPPAPGRGLYVLDAKGGGSGTRFDWSRLAPRAPDRCFIAGGIDQSNVAELLRYRPFGIDVSSGVERRPGVKDPERMRGLFAAISAAAAAATGGGDGRNR